MEHPYLAEEFEVKWSNLTPDHIVKDIRKGIEIAKANIETIAKIKHDEATFENAFLALDDATELLDQAWGKIGNQKGCCDNPEFRKAFGEILPEVSNFYSSICLNEDLYKLLSSAAKNTDLDKLKPSYKRFIEETLIDFEQAGAALPKAEKEELETLNQQLSELTKQYGENSLDSLNDFELIIEDETRLKGLPERVIEGAKQDALANGKGDESNVAWRFTLQAPSMIPIMTYADDASLRKEIYEAYMQVGVKGEWNNTKILKEILLLRQKKAQLLGKENFADFVTERRMAGSGKNALNFILDLHKQVECAFKTELNELETYKAEQTNSQIEALEAWERAYWGEKMRQERYDFDEEELRPYFPVKSVIDGLFDLVEKIFALKVKERIGENKPDVWHPDVNFYDIFDEENIHLGSFYTDWHPRESKRGGAWMDSIITGERLEGRAHTPHLGMIFGNMTKATANKPALLDHREVQTIFHEFGHLLHQVCGDVEIKSLNGTSVSWDFVELPSQILENWCWERESLNLFARHYETGENIPDDLFEKMIRAKNFQSGMFFMRQLSLGKMDLELHLNPEIAQSEDIDKLIREWTKGFTPRQKTQYPSMIRNFGHLFSSSVGYAAGYYSYKWAEVLEADAFNKFKEQGILNRETGKLFREKILAKGNSEDPNKLFKDFMGREPDANALLIREGLK